MPQGGHVEAFQQFASRGCQMRVGRKATKTHRGPWSVENICRYYPPRLDSIPAMTRHGAENGHVGAVIPTKGGCRYPS